MSGDTTDELRILAKDGGRLSAEDCRMLARAADEYEVLVKTLVQTQAQLIEAQQRQIAANEQLLELRRPKPTLADALAGQPLSMGLSFSGPGREHAWGKP